MGSVLIIGWNWLKKAGLKTAEYGPGVVNVAARAGVPYAGAIDAAVSCCCANFAY